MFYDSPLYVFIFLTITFVNFVLKYDIGRRIVKITIIIILSLKNFIIKITHTV